MNHGKFVKRNQLISEHLASIAQTHARGETGLSMIPTSPAFRDLLVAQERLLLAAERLLDGGAQRIAA